MKQVTHTRKYFKVNNMRLYKVAFENGRKVTVLASNLNEAVDKAQQIIASCYKHIIDPGPVSSVQVDGNFHASILDCAMIEKNGVTSGERNDAQ